MVRPSPYSFDGPHPDEERDEEETRRQLGLEESAMNVLPRSGEGEASSIAASYVVLRN